MTNLALSEPQKKIATDKARFRVVVAGRRFGKTHLAIRELCYHAKEPNRECWAVMPTYRQAKQVVWRKLKKQLQELRWIEKINESELSITLKNNSTISLKGADNYDSLRGVGLDFIVLDEFADIAPEAWFETLRPTLSDTGGKALFIGTPKGIGNWAYELYQMQEEDPINWHSYSYTTICGGRVPQSEIEQAQKDLDVRTFRQEYLATFETFSGRIYYAFDRKENVRSIEALNTDVILTGWDFNIDPMSIVVAVRQGDDIYVIDEVRMYSSNTQEAVEEVRARYPKSKIWAYPDPACRARKTSAGGSTDLIQLQNAGFVVKCPHAHTPVRDRINAVNSRLCDSKGTRHLFIDAKCKHTIEGLERQVYKEGTSTPDKESGYDHGNDALGYMIDFIFPIRKDVTNVTQPRSWGHGIAV